MLNHDFLLIEFILERQFIDNTKLLLKRNHKLCKWVSNEVRKEMTQFCLHLNFNYFIIFLILHE